MTMLRHTLLGSALLLAACAAPTDQPSDPSDESRTRFRVVDTLPEGSFGAEGEGAFSGDLTVRGYADTVTVDEPFCTENCRKFTYVFFEIDETGNEGLLDFLPVNEGNAYVRPSAIGLGCVEDDVIHYSNQSDRNQMAEFRLDPTLSQAILESSAANPVTLHLTKLPLSGGTEAPACYAHFTTVELAENQ